MEILVIDDEVQICEILQALVEAKLELKVDTALNAKEGLELFLNGNYKVVVSDVKMPEKSGVWLAEQIRLKDSSIPIIFMSGFTSATDEEIQALNIQHFVRKPDGIRELPDVIERILK